MAGVVAMISYDDFARNAERCEARFERTRSDADADSWARSIEDLAAARTLPIRADRIRVLTAALRTEKGWVKRERLAAELRASQRQVTEIQRRAV